MIVIVSYNSAKGYTKVVTSRSEFFLRNRKGWGMGDMEAYRKGDGGVRVKRVHSIQAQPLSS